ncbi:MAG: DMT family transporter [Rubritepida sp.]|nr:DMT family transporter [Rubritepida sp.]
MLLIATAFGWGSNWPMLKLLLTELPPLQARGAAGVTAGLGFALGAWAFGVPLRVPRRLWSRLVLASLLNVTAWMGFATFGLVWLGAGEAAILAYTVPVWTALLAWPVLGEAPSARRVAALLLSLTGVAILFAGRGLDFGLAKLPGMALMTGAAVLFALGTVWGKRTPLGLPPVASVAWQVGLGCAPLLLLGLLFEPWRWGTLSSQGWFFMGWMTAIPLGLAYLTWFEAIKRVPATFATVAMLLAPMVGVAGAALVLGEPFGLREAAALLLTLAGVLLASFG